jgi:chlorobactene lauroyltransferase
MIEASKNAAIEALFARLNRRMLRRHFHQLHLQGADRLQRLDRSLPVVFYGNHSNWWDGLIEFYLGREIFHVDSYLMMEEKQMVRYRFFRFIGAFSVNRGSPREAYESVRYASQVAAGPNRALWIYPQGDMRPNDVRPLRFFPGIGHIANMLGRAQFVPVARTYEFMKEQLPEVFTAIGEPVLVAEAERPKTLSARLETLLTAQLDELRRNVIAERYNGFTTILRGRASTNVVYDRARMKETK